ncbi:hypothetical protein C6988_08235 [Nitrosopumilus sp. b1]|uniref:hypothetical protein n=1 Tax=Nitrosopumilus sp. b1 TaxID=2109907 RepID=UPI0015F67AA5|nr:hypothetical protein [Nitrosopumilus sp. b1]KAF6242641.1 hypothetical protein C6988_08235 [Nitrosopumilus sp. b1]
MKKRGIVIGIIGILISTASFSMVFSFFPQSQTGLDGNFILPELLEDMFDDVSVETEIMAGQSSVFSFSTSDSDVPLLWGVQIIDYKEDDNLSIEISNIFGDSLGVFEQQGPVLFEIFLAPSSEVYNFEITNQGSRAVLAVMMFAEDPDNSEAFSNPNSPLMTTLVPLAIAGIILIIGIIVVIAGAIITAFDWKKGQDESRYL